MKLGRALIVLAIVAALWGAPSSVSAAANQLTSPQVSPGSGTVTTVFTFRVRYDGAFPATSVTVSVADLTLPMLLESGSITGGWWTVASPLPIGAWSTTFASSAARGPAATVDGPVVVVAAAVSAPPSASSAPTPPSLGATPESAPVGDPDDSAIASTAPDSAPDEAAATADAAATPAAGPAAPASSSADGDEPAPGGGSVAAPDATAAGDAGDGEPADDAAPAPSWVGAPSTTDAAARMGTGNDGRSGDAAPTADDLVSTLLLLGLAGVASVAIIGTLLLLAGRRREPARATAAPTAPVGAATERPRIARRTAASPSDDPIVAALGVDDEMAARRAIRRARASRLASGTQAERPTRR